MKTLDGKHRAEDLFATDTHRRGHVLEDGGQKIVSFLQRGLSRSFAAGEKFRSLVEPGLNIALYPLTMLRRDQRPEVRRRIKRVTNLEIRDCFEKPLHKAVVNSILENQSRSGDARLPLAAKDRPHRPLHRHFQISVAEA